MNARGVCAVLGVAAAVGAVVFMRSLVATNDHQSIAVAEKLLKALPVAPGAPVSSFALDHRPGGRVMQGPPLTATIAVDDSLKGDGIVVSRALFAQRRLKVPPVGSELKLIGRNGAYKIKIDAVKDWDRPLRGYPNAFVSASAAKAIAEDWRPWIEKPAQELSAGFMSDSQRNFNRARALMIWAAALTALSLLVNSLLILIEDRRREIAVLRMLGMTRSGVFFMLAKESSVLASVGCALGVALSIAALRIYVGCDGAQFPLGMAVSWSSVALAAILVFPIAMLAVLISLKSAFSVRPAEAASLRPKRRTHFGMLIAFACGFGAFVAVEVWGASLMGAFVPSKEWPDAIVSILPGGVSSFDIDRLRGKVPGVKKIHELQPLQVNIHPLEEIRGGRSRGRRKEYRNALLLASDWLPDFRFSSGERERALKDVMSGDCCIITEMMARARALKLGDEIVLDASGGLKVPLKIVGIVDLNWHLVTSRALVRGLRRMPVMTDGPLFVSFDTLEACDPRPAAMVRMTHLWLDYEREFLERNGVFGAGRKVESEIVKALGLANVEVESNAVRLHARDEIADGTLHHGASIIGSMARVPFIFVAVLSLGFVAMLVASAKSRRHEFLVLRAVGATRLFLALVLTVEAVKVAAAGMALALPGGALAGWLFTAGTRAAMSHWGIPAAFAIPLKEIAAGAAWSMVFVLAVAIPVALRVIGGRNRN